MSRWTMGFVAFDEYAQIVAQVLGTFACLKICPFDISIDEHIHDAAIDQNMACKLHKVA